MNYMDRVLLETLVARGLSSHKIATELEVSQTTIQYWLKKYGLTTSPRPYSCSCGETSPDKFYKRMKSSCKSCHNVKTTKRKQDVKTRIVEELGGKCVRCGYDRFQGALQLHHKDPATKDPDFESFANRSFEAYKEELEKCELVCANCHAEIHWKV